MLLLSSLNLEMRIILVRHGQTDANKEGRFQGASDAPLNQVGQSQAQALSRRLSSESLDVVYSSPQTRALQTASPIAQAHALSVDTVQNLRELDIGELDGLQGPDLRERYPHILEQWRINVGALTMPGGESIIGLQERAWNAILHIRDSHPTGTVVAVSHNFAIQSILLKALGMDLRNFQRIRQDLAAITELDFSNGDPVLRSLNDRCHLSGLE